MVAVTENFSPIPLRASPPIGSEIDGAGVEINEAAPTFSDVPALEIPVASNGSRGVRSIDMFLPLWEQDDTPCDLLISLSCLLV